MQKRNKQRVPLPILETDPELGLTQAQVRQRTEAGWISGTPKTAGKSGFEIAFSHIFTFFNLIFVLLAVLLVLGGSSVKNMTFLIAVLCNTVIGIIQELRAKKAVDRLTLIAARPLRVIRDGQPAQVPPDKLVRDDIAEFGPGDQLPADGVLVRGQLSLDESLLTGEADAMPKLPGNPVFSGSVVLSGRGRVRLTAVGADSFAAGLTREAKKSHSASKSGMMRSLDRLIRVVGILLIPAGGLLLWQEYTVLGLGLRSSVESVVAALVGMIPEGLYLLTSIALAASTLKLSREQVLVQDMNRIEALARVDVLCLDKTGTLTEPGMAVSRLIPLDGNPTESCETVLAALFGSREPDNDTARAFAARYSQKTDWICEQYIPFTTETRFSGGTFRDHGTFLIGAPDVLLPRNFPEIREKAQAFAGEGYRVLLLVQKTDAQQLRPLALCLLTGTLRKNARQVLSDFAAQGVSLRVISGDDAATASRIALQAGIPQGERYINTTDLESDADFRHAAGNYRVFGRVTPEQKRRLIRALQELGHTVAMTGDGVNDLLAMKQADCSIAMASGAQAASQCAGFVLLQSDFAAIPGITAEGRRVINNIQRAAALFLVKNIFSLGLSLLSLATGLPYPFQPIHLTLIAALTIGIPSFFLALEPSYQPIRGKFLPEVLRRALPGGITNILTVLMIQALAPVFRLSQGDISTLCTAAIGTVGLLVLLQVCKPWDKFRKLIWFAMASSLVLCFTLLGGLFELGLSASILLPLLALLVAAPAVFFAVQALWNLAAAPRTPTPAI